MRIPLQVVLLGLSIATATLIFEGAKRAMSGKHRRSPKQGDSPTAKEAKIARETAHVEDTASVPTEKEVAAAEAARARLNGDQTTTASTSEGKLPDGPEPVVIDIDYITSGQLLPLEKDTVNEQLQAAVQQLDARDWTQAIQGLNVVRQAAVHHKHTLEPSLSRVVPLVLNSVKSLRSSLCKTAVMCVADLFSVFGNSMEPYMDLGSLTRPANSLLLQLLLKASSNDKRFVIEEVQQSLRIMAGSVDPAVCLDRLVPYAAHRNPKVRAQVAVVLTAAAEQMTPEDLVQYGNDKLLKVGGALVTDNTPDARTAARGLLTLLRKSHDTAASTASTSDGEKENSPAVVRDSSNISRNTGRALTSKPAVKDSRPACDDPESNVDAWESYCRSMLAPSVAAAVLKVVNK
ncbi:TPA: hypothetical protein ACH3X1_008572 [Trebouxia sp. C0004]